MHKWITDVTYKIGVLKNARGLLTLPVGNFALGDAKLDALMDILATERPPWASDDDADASVGVLAAHRAYVERCLASVKAQAIAGLQTSLGKYAAFAKRVSAAGKERVAFEKVGETASGLTSSGKACPASCDFSRLYVTRFYKHWLPQVIGCGNEKGVSVDALLWAPFMVPFSDLAASSAVHLEATMSCRIKPSETETNVEAAAEAADKFRSDSLLSLSTCSQNHFRMTKLVTAVEEFAADWNAGGSSADRDLPGFILEAFSNVLQDQKTKLLV